MPFPEDLLNPIDGPNPSGVNLRYDPVYDKIKEARREEDHPPPRLMGEPADRSAQQSEWP